MHIYDFKLLVPIVYSKNGHSCLSYKCFSNKTSWPNTSRTPTSQPPMYVHQRIPMFNDHSKLSVFFQFPGKISPAKNIVQVQVAQDSFVCFAKNDRVKEGDLDLQTEDLDLQLKTFTCKLKALGFELTWIIV